MPQTTKRKKTTASPAQLRAIAAAQAAKAIPEGLTGVKIYMQLPDWAIAQLDGMTAHDRGVAMLKGLAQ